MERILKREIQRLFPILEAIKEGKTIQWRDTGIWRDIDGDNEGFCLDTMTRRTDLYRIKPESKYRPFRNADECWNEMKKHQPFGWVESSKTGAKYEIQCLKRGGGGKIYSYDDIFFSNFEEFFEDYKFDDGTPFGILED